MATLADVEDKVDKIAGSVDRLGDRVGELDKRIDHHDRQDQARHDDIREDLKVIRQDTRRDIGEMRRSSSTELSALRRDAARLMMAGLLVIVIAMALLAGVVGVSLRLDSSRVSVSGRDAVVIPRQEP